MKKAPAKKSVEMGNIPVEFHASAGASILALGKPMEWVFVPLGRTKRPAFKFDLRFRSVA